MTDGVSDTPANAGTVGPIPIEGVTTYLRCPRQYEYAHVQELEGERDEAAATIEDRVAILKTAICDALDRDEADRDRTTLLDAARARLETLWEDHDERFHSVAQRRHERRVLEATLEAYVDAVGLEHASGIDRLRSAIDGGEVIGPECSLSSTQSLSETATADEGDAVTISAPIDYCYADGSSIVGVRFVPTLRPLGLLRYRSDWEGAVAEQFTDHFDPEADVFEPSFVGALFETAVVLDGLRNRCKRFGLEDRTCRYVQIPLADRSRTAVNWVQETVETTLEPIDLTDRYVDHHTYGMTHEHRNRTIDDRLERVVADLTAGAFDPTDRWEQLSSEVCPDCAYTVCCEDYIAAEVRFDG
ncbi:hypothetical protein RBH26_08255 [Natronolimnohabitans sp. A-GB9]|uniref:hypothetical protein n=1 Tax=Natronolimnohabitans sp. A-GB9 TaxID=3069757 RepID=UPI0027B09B1D|nr:hypothetical protein [Natronolimnohabitans sp. A-GB9]MDQ2050478.1 hypothetical protein [Natronolimnohabitans sp. A-GB9]